MPRKSTSQTNGSRKVHPVERNGHGIGIEESDDHEPASGIDDISPVDDFDDAADVEMEAGQCFRHKVLSLSREAVCCCCNCVIGRIVVECFLRSTLAK